MIIVVASILAIALLFIPFVRIADKQALKEEAEARAAEAAEA